jgi:ferric hydroxamate transport system substrate-binding protein
MNGVFTRRRVLQGLLSLPPALCWAQPRARAAQSGSLRIVSMSWELTETLLLLGHVPVGLSLPEWYRSTMVEPTLPEGVVDIGLLYQPNFQVLLELAPDLMILTPGHAPLQPALARLGPTLTLGSYIGASDPWPALLRDTRDMAQALNSQARAETLIGETEQLLADTQRRLSGHPGRSVIVADLIDEHYLRVYGPGSLFDAVLGKIGVRNAASPDNGLTVAQSGSALIPVQRLAQVHDCELLLSPVAPHLSAALQDDPVWQALPVVRGQRVSSLPVIAPYGGLRSMQRFAAAVGQALSPSARQEKSDV